MIERKLTVSEVSINQVTVEIKVLKIGNRQVTLAVFRQLQEEDIFNFDTSELNGKPWGWVNYHPDDGSCYKSEHYHIIWQKGNELRRATVLPLPPPGKGNFKKLDEAVQRYSINYVAARILEGWRPAISLEDEELMLCKNQFLHLSLPFEIDLSSEISVEIRRLPRDLTNAWCLSEDYYGGATAGNPDIWEICTQKRVASHLDNLPIDSRMIAMEYLLPLKKHYDSLMASYKQLYNQIMQLEQLFIAV
jgi:hypothetical protein